MNRFRVARIAAIAAATSLLLAAIAPAADAPTPVVKITASISPKKIGKVHNGIGTPVALTVNTAFSVNPSTADPFVIQHAVVFFPKGAVANGRLFPSCSAAQLNRAHGALRKCPKGSVIGGGIVKVRAIELGLNASAKANLLNGPGGRSVTFNFAATIPAVINQSFDAPLVKLHGKYGYKLTLDVPASLRTIIGSRIAVKTFNVTTKATIVKHGVKRGYIEAIACPKSKKAPLHLDVTYVGGATSSVDSQIACS